MSARDTVSLVKKLEVELKAGTTGQYGKNREKAIEAAPKVKCEFCGGDGKAPGNQACQTCQGTGRRGPREAQYPFSVENVQEFVAFLKASGGFSIK